MGHAPMGRMDIGLHGSVRSRRGECDGHAGRLLGPRLLRRLLDGRGRADELRRAPPRPGGRAIVVGAWDGEQFEGLDTVLPSIASQLVLHARRHCAYPTIHYFHSKAPEPALSVQAARLGDALLLLRESAQASRRFDAFVRELARFNRRFSGDDR